MSEVMQLFLLALLASIIALVGGMVFLFSGKLSATLQRHSIPFAAGVLITVSLVALVPEAVEHFGEEAFLVVLLSFFGAFLFEHFFLHIHHHDTGHDKVANKFEAAVPLVIVGDTIHNFIDGVVIAASFLVNPGLGLIAAIATFLHEVPHEIGDFGILLKAGWKRANIIIVNVISASATIVGAFLIYGVSRDSSFIGMMLAISAGIFLYLGTVDFLPHITEGYKNRARSIVPLAVGIIIMLSIIMLVPHSDEHDEDEGELNYTGTLLPEPDTP